MRGPQTAKKTCKASGIGGKESVKGNRRGSLSRSIKPFFKLWKRLKNAGPSAQRFSKILAPLVFSQRFSSATHTPRIAPQIPR